MLRAALRLRASFKSSCCSTAVLTCRAFATAANAAAPTLNAGLLRTLEERRSVHASLSERLSSEAAIAMPHAEFAQLSREMTKLTPLADALTLLEGKQEEAAELDAMLKEARAGGDDEMEEMARVDLDDVRSVIGETEEELVRLLLPRDADDGRNAVLEVRAGTGGEEAALFAADVFKMYK
jgi:peptide chain release factor 1